MFIWYVYCTDEGNITKCLAVAGFFYLMSIWLEKGFRCSGGFILRVEVYMEQYIRLAKKGSFCRSYIFLEVVDWICFFFALWGLFWGWTAKDLEGLGRTNGNFVGISWEKLGTFGVDVEGVRKIFGNFVGITWE